MSADALVVGTFYAPSAGPLIAVCALMMMMLMMGGCVLCCWSSEPPSLQCLPEQHAATSSTHLTTLAVGIIICHSA